MGEITNLKEVASAPKGCGLKVNQIVSWQEDQQGYFHKCKRNKDKCRYNVGLNIIKKVFLKGCEQNMNIGVVQIAVKYDNKQISLIK